MYLTTPSPLMWVWENLQRSQPGKRRLYLVRTGARIAKAATLDIQRTSYSSDLNFSLCWADSHSPISAFLPTSLPWDPSQFSLLPFSGSLPSYISLKASIPPLQKKKKRSGMTFTIVQLVTPPISFTFLPTHVFFFCLDQKLLKAGSVWSSEFIKYLA